MRPRLPGSLARRLRADGGFALPTTLMLLLAAFAMVSVGVVASINTQRGTVRDQGTKSAVQLAETGVHQAFLHFNRINPSTTNYCSPVSSTGPDATGWCPAVSGSDSAGGTFTYQARSCDAFGGCPPSLDHAPYQLEVLATGTRGNTTRRVYVRAHSASGQMMFGDYQVKAGELITLDSDAKIHAGTASNGDIILASNAKQCGPASVGIGHVFQQASANSYFSDQACTVPETIVGEEEIFLPPVNQGDVVTNNDNWRFFTNDPVSGSKPQVCWNGVRANGAPGSCGSRHLELNSNTAVTLGGSKYSFCKLTMSSNTSLLSAAGKTATIYFDSPESCGYESGTVQLEMASNTRISSNDGQQVRLLFVGSEERDTLIHFSSETDSNAACVQNFVLYAPLTDVVLNSNSTYCGSFAGKTLYLNSLADMRTNGPSQRFVVPNTAPHYVVSDFIECTATPASPPNAGC